MTLPSLVSNRLAPVAWTAATSVESREKVSLARPAKMVGADHRSLPVAMSQTWSPPSRVAATVPSGEKAAVFTAPPGLGSV